MITNYTVKLFDIAGSPRVFEYLVSDGVIWRRDRNSPDGPVLIKVEALDNLIMACCDRNALARVENGDG